METAKKVISGIFQKNYELGEIDDRIFIPIIRAGIENSGSEDIQKALYDFALAEFIDVWIECAKEDEGDDVDLEAEKKEAINEFLIYWKKEDS
mgnify:CR=1 FL=1